MNGVSAAYIARLTLDETVGEAVEHPHDQLLDGAEVVVDEPVVEPGRLGDAPRREPGRADLAEQPLGGVEQRLLVVLAGA